MFTLDDKRALRASGSLTIADHPTDPIEIDCQKCGRNGRYRKATQIEKHGSDIVLPDPGVRAFFAKEEPEFKHS